MLIILCWLCWKGSSYRIDSADIEPTYVEWSKFWIFSGNSWTKGGISADVIWGKIWNGEEKEKNMKTKRGKTKRGNVEIKSIKDIWSVQKALSEHLTAQALSTLSKRFQSIAAKLKRQSNEAHLCISPYNILPLMYCTVPYS
jgi:hypothetical protein